MSEKVTLCPPQEGWTAEGLAAELQKLPPGYKVGVYEIDRVTSMFWFVIHSDGHEEADDNDSIVLLY